MEIQVVHTGDAIRRQEASTKRVGDNVMKHHVNAVIEDRKFDEFWQVTLVLIDTNHRASIDIHQSKSIDRSTRASIDMSTRASIDNAYGINRVLQCRKDSNSREVRSKTPTSAQS